MYRICLPVFRAAEHLVAGLHSTHPQVTILARGRDAKQCQALQALGARLAISENLEASLDLAREALAHELVAASEIETLLRRFRGEYYANLDNASARQSADAPRR